MSLRHVQRESQTISLKRWPRAMCIEKSPLHRTSSQAEAFSSGSLRTKSHSEGLKMSSEGGCPFRTTI